MYPLKIFGLICFMVFSGFGLPACTPNEEVGPEAVLPAVNADVPETILARVDETQITDLDVKLAIESTFGEAKASRLRPEQKQKVLESLVMSRAMARVAAAELAPEKMAVIEKRVQAFREQLMVKHYLEERADPRPVSQQMIADYYKAHPERFGGRTICTYEMLFSKPMTSTADRDELLNAMKTGGRRNDWQEWSRQLLRGGLPVQYRKGEVDDRVLSADLRSLMTALEEGMTSNVTFIDDCAYMVRITEAVQIPPRPLREVSDQIRRTLMPSQIKAAISQVSGEIMQEVQITYAASTKGLQ